MQGLEFQGKSQSVADIFFEVEAWIEHSRWRSYDPSDIKGHPLFIRLESVRRRSNAGKQFLRPIFYLERNQRSLLRALLRVSPKEYPQAVGTVARAYFKAYQRTGVVQFRDSGVRCLEWLSRNTSDGYDLPCWGQPYDWYSRVLVPANTPRATVSTICVNAFLDGYELTGDDQYLETAKQGCEFFVRHLRRTPDAAGHICFSYTPIDTFQVHNASVLVAGLLLRTQSFVGDHRYEALALSALHFTADDQYEDGAWDYWATPQRTADRQKIDHYHTGFVLEGFLQARRALRSYPFEDVLLRGIDFYLKNLFVDNDGGVKNKHDQRYPVDIQSCAQALITLGEVTETEDLDMNERAHRVLQWTLNNMYAPERGYFFHKIFSNGKIEKTPYLRWSQSWMLRGLSYWMTHGEKSCPAR